MLLFKDNTHCALIQGQHTLCSYSRTTHTVLLFKDNTHCALTQGQHTLCSYSRTTHTHCALIQGQHTLCSYSRITHTGHSFNDNIHTHCAFIQGQPPPGVRDPPPVASGSWPGAPGTSHTRPSASGCCCSLEDEGKQSNSCAAPAIDALHDC